MVWGAIYHGGRGPLIRLQMPEKGGFAAEQYISQILRPVLKPLYTRVRTHWRGYDDRVVVIEDNAPSHASGISEATRDELGIPTLPHPPRSPDLNPIEHVWAELKRRINMLPTRPRSKEELWEAAQHVWQEIPQTFIDKVIDSMPYRRNAVRKNRGYHTRW